MYESYMYAYRLSDLSSQKMSIRVNSQAAFDGAKLAGMNPIMMGDKISNQELVSMSFSDLKERLSLDYIPSSDARTKEDLLAIYKRDWQADKMRLPLFVKRGRRGQQANFSMGDMVDVPEEEKSDGRVGLLSCKSKLCYKSEDGFTPFQICSACRGPAYCSVACQREEWKTHKSECKKYKEESEMYDKSNASMKDMLKNIMQLLPKK